ncbi:MAG: sel1 repeat family protein [Oscillospiraceae bacterium]|nr:sel1 repeat family protein [Oscillospiraceae bacterium]
MGRIKIDSEQLKRIARYEETFEQYADVLKEGELGYAFDITDDYRITLNDVSAALSNITVKDPFDYDFARYWVYPVLELRDHFGLKPAWGDNENMSQKSVKVRGLPVTEDDMIGEIWDFFYTVAAFSYYSDGYEEEEWQGDRVTEYERFPEYVNEIELFRKNIDKPVSEREYSKRQKHSFIEVFRNGWRVENANDTELELCRKFTDEFAEDDDTYALWLKGYSCYGGSSLYPCDWIMSRDCIERLYEITDDPDYANTLGYIYYYGRCTNGEPEYEKAFRMFSVAAANGLYEGMYKLADMYRHGYACRKSPRTAFSLYRLVYNDAINGFVHGENNEFADAALRMGNVYLNGIGVEKDPENAYDYYLEADFAAKRRAKENDFFGNTNVVMSIQEALNETRAQLPEDYWQEYFSFSNPEILDLMIDDSFHAAISVTKPRNGSRKITVKRKPYHKGGWIRPQLLSYGPINYCDMVTKIQLTAVDAEVSPEFDGRKEIEYDQVFYNHRKGRYDLYFRDEFAGWFRFEELRLYPPKKKKPSGELLRFVSISFQSGNRTYDYLCDIPEIEPGDRVIVEGYDGETEVTVQKVFTEYESELGLPLDRYKRILRKA